MFDLVRDLRQVQRPFDVIVVGGGITGVQIARHAAGRGLRTLLLEKDDFGSGTSSATTKAIHGGLRYLEQYQFGVVAESVAERHSFAITAPHLVASQRFLLAAWEWSKPPAPVLGAGVALYEAMAWNRNLGVLPDARSGRMRWVGKAETLRRIPWLDPTGLKGAWDHGDSINLHAERLLLALVKQAVALGAVAFNHAPVTGMVTEPASTTDGVHVRGVTFRDELTGEEHTARATVVVNAAGPEVARVLGDLAPRTGLRVQRAKGVHLITPRLGGTDSLFAGTREGRHFVVNQWLDRSLIGPTDTPLTADDEVAATAEDVDSLLATANAVAARPLTRKDVLTTTVGVRPLVDDGKPSYKASRKFVVHDHREQGIEGLVSITGGKWTTGRALGAEVIDHVVAAFPSLPPTRRFDSFRLPVAGAFGDYPSLEAAFESALRRWPHLDLSREVRLHLARMYGTEHESVLALVEADPALGQRLSSAPGRLDIAAQAVFAVTNEGAASLADIVDRRLSAGTLAPVSAEELQSVAAVAGSLLGWDEPTRQARVDEYLAAQNKRQSVLEE